MSDAKTPSVPPWFFRQSAVVPWRRGDAGIEVLLITSNRRRRWIIPKGVVEPHLSPQDSAAQEAYEEAGVRGDVDREPLGTYTYDKWGGTCTCTVYPMAVTEVLETWPEPHRDRCWVSPETAAQRVKESGLAEMLRALPARLEGR